MLNVPYLQIVWVVGRFEGVLLFKASPTKVLHSTMLAFFSAIKTHFRMIDCQTVLFEEPTKKKKNSVGSFFMIFAVRISLYNYKRLTFLQKNFIIKKYYCYRFEGYQYSG